MTELIDELAKEAIKLTSKPDILDHDFEKQASFIRDPAKLKAGWCTRRSAKSYTSGLYLADTALRYDNCNCLYIGLTRASAKGIIWKDVLKTINQKHDLGMAFNGSELTSTFPNGSVIHVTGIDAAEDEMHKLLGKKWKLVIIDEAQSYSIDLRNLIYGILGPAMIDMDGTICMMGTAGNLTQSLFYDVTTKKEPGWKVFEWTALDNPYVARQWQDELDKIKRERPLFMETALFKQWYLNKWVIDEDAKVYKFHESRNLTDLLPYQLEHWHYVLGLDLAHSPDSTAFVIGCYNDASPTLYIVESYKALGMDLTDVATKLKEFDSKYHFEVRVVDGANKQAVAELNNRHGTNLIPADKTGKVDFITLMNDDFTQGKIKLVTNQTKDLQNEYNKLVWLTDANGKVKEPKKENPVIHQDLCDAALYLWRYCYQYLFEPIGGVMNSSDQKVWEPLHIARLSQQIKDAQNPHHLDIDKPEDIDDWESQWKEFNL